jgi:hypothetical protein
MEKPRNDLREKVILLVWIMLITVLVLATTTLLLGRFTFIGYRVCLLGSGILVGLVAFVFGSILVLEFMGIVVFRAFTRKDRE